MTDKNTFGKRLSELIEKRGVSKYKVGQVTGINQTTLANYIADKTKNPSTALVNSLANFFRVTPEWLLTGRLADGEISPLSQEYLKVSVDDSLLEDDKRIASLARFLSRYHERLIKNEVFLTYIDKVIEVHYGKKEIEEVKQLQNRKNQS